MGQLSGVGTVQCGSCQVDGVGIVHCRSGKWGRYSPLWVMSGWGLGRGGRRSTVDYVR